MRFRPLLPILFLSLVAAKGGKKKEEAPPPPPAPAAPAPVEAAPPPPPAPEEPPAPKSVKNVSATVTITFADGTSKSGKVQGIERSVDFNADEGWTEDAGKIKFTVEAGSSEKQVAWTDVKSISVIPGKIPDDVDCSYSSDFSPWMYECALRTTSNVVMKDGSKGVITNRHKWRLYFEDGSNTELFVYKYVVREQDDRNLEFGDEATENFALYTKLQDKLRGDAKTAIVKSITVQ